MFLTGKFYRKNYDFSEISKTLMLLGFEYLKN